MSVSNKHKESLVNRKNLTRLRVSSHKLSVETGRFNKTPLENRLCAMCDKGLVEDEFHLMISCTAYEKPRDHLFKYLSSFTDIHNFSDNEIFSVLMSYNNGDYEFTKAVCNFVNLSFEKRSDHLESVNKILLFHSVCFICCSLIACFSILISTWVTHNARRCRSCGWSAHNQCGYIVSLQWRPRRVLCPPGGLLQLWPVVYATMCISHFIVIFVLHCIQWFCTIALYFRLVF